MTEKRLPTSGVVRRTWITVSLIERRWMEKFERLKLDGDKFDKNKIDRGQFERTSCMEKRDNGKFNRLDTDRFDRDKS